jgi:uncharacterized protein (DUF849 family)
MAATPENLLHVVRSLPPGSVWQSIGIGKANLDFAAMAMTLGGNARTGLEDNLYLRRGELSPGNAPLVSRGGRHRPRARPTARDRRRGEGAAVGDRAADTETGSPVSVTHAAGRRSVSR